MTGEEFARELVHTVSTEYGVTGNHLVATMRDRVSANGVAMRTVGETTLSRRAEIEFAGEDFCLRFEFALRLRDLLLPLADHQLIGKLHIHQQDGTTPVELNLIKVSKHHFHHWD